MDRRGEVEIVINVRWIERAFFLLIIVALIGFTVWQQTNQASEADVESLTRLAELENTVIQKDDELSALRTQVALLEARIADNEAEEETPVAAPVAPATPAPTLPSILNAAWEFDGAQISANQYRLASATIFITNTYTTPAIINYELCWSTIECEKVVTRGTFTAPASRDTEYDVTITLPRFVDTQSTQRLKMRILNGTSVLLSEERTIR